MTGWAGNGRALVTGGAGFIGSHIVERLLGDGLDVTVLDNFSTGRPENLAQLEKQSRLHLHRVDVANYDAILPFFRDIHYVFHVAALADIVPSMQTPLNYHRSNVDGTASVAEASRKSGVSRLVYAASSSCYG